MSAGSWILSLSILGIFICMITIYKSGVVGFWNDTDGLDITDVLAFGTTIFTLVMLSIFIYKLVLVSIPMEYYDLWTFVVKGLLSLQTIVLTGYFAKGSINNAVNKIVDYKSSSNNTNNDDDNVKG